MDRTLSAPGKLFLAGEYAVLWGGAARVLAVGPRLRAFVRTRSDRRVDVLLAAGRWSGPATPAGVAWESPPPPDFHFVARTIDLALRAAGQDGPGFTLALEPSLTAGGRKLGFGSSARACVLAAEAARTALGASFDALKLALVAHASAQGGRGSGADVSACFAGDLVRYRRFETGPLLLAANGPGFGGALARSSPVELSRVSPPRLPLLYVFSGQSASTPRLIAEVEGRLDEEARARFVSQSDALGQVLDESLARADFASASKASAALQELLSSLGPTRAEPLERTLALARAFGCAAKQSGAGGGDGCLVIAPDGPTRDAAREAFEARGLVSMPLEPAVGLRGEAAPPPELLAWVQAVS